MNWSTYQSTIFDAVANSNSNLAINAVAGSGKTTTIVEAARLLEGDVAFLAFNKHIVGELERRLPSNVRAMTIHSLGYQALRRQTRRLTMAEYKHADIVDALLNRTMVGRSAAFKRSVGRLVELARLTLTSLNDSDSIGELISHHAISAQIAEAVEELSEIDPDGPWSYGQVYDRVVSLSTRVVSEGIREYRESGKIDFTDMLYLPYALRIAPQRFSTVLVDEAQDLSAAQLALVIAAGERIIAVGDPAQAIQGFAGADNRSFANLVERTDAVELPLSVCYRCPTSHLMLAQSIVPHIEAREDAPAGRILRIGKEEPGQAGRQHRQTQAWAGPDLAHRVCAADGALRGEQTGRAGPEASLGSGHPDAGRQHRLPAGVSRRPAKHPVAGGHQEQFDRPVRRCRGQRVAVQHPPGKRAGSRPGFCAGARQDVAGSAGDAALAG